MNQRLVCLTLAVGLSGSLPAQTPRERIADVIEPILLNPPCDGLLIFDVFPKLQADRAGFKIGDVITHYDGKLVRTATQLQRSAQLAASENRGNLLVVAMRNGEKREAELDAAPLGVRLVSIDRQSKRILWRSPTPYEPDYSVVQRRLTKNHRWDLVMFGDRPVGWAHTFFTERDGRKVMRVQSQTKTELTSQGKSEPFNDHRDLTIGFQASKPNLELSSLRLVVNNKLALDLVVHDGVLEGERGGLHDSAPLPADALAADLAGLAVSMMPRQHGACLRCSFLESGSLVAAPFADLYCLGPETVHTGKENVAAFRYDQTVFGLSTAHYWIDAAGEVVQTKLGSGFRIVRTTSTDVGLQFPNAMSEFPPIEQLPRSAASDAPAAN